ncbi:MAG: ADP-ribosylglycohydrolase family protein [Mogibacterium sp.]|nr:ADP-ribosylglycohydrolase family protein [Mogibacterium sp.]
MLGALYGDIIGSRFEHRNIKTKKFDLFNNYSRFTDDSVMTIAIADAIMFYFDYDNGTGDLFDEKEAENLRTRVINAMRKWGLRYPDAGYGGRFYQWLHDADGPYNSWGNGSAMRVSPVAWIFDDIDTVRKAAVITAEVTHNHPEGIKGAEAIASAVFLARKGFHKPEIKEYIVREFGYDLDRDLDVIRLTYQFDVSCQGSVPEAIIAFLEGKDMVDTIRNAISIGGDSDTIAAMAGSIAEAYYGTDSSESIAWILDKLEPDMKKVVDEFTKHRRKERVTDKDPEYKEYFRISHYRKTLIPDDLRVYIAHYQRCRSLYKTAEAFGTTTEKVREIIRLAEPYCVRKDRDNCDIIDYIDEVCPGRLARSENEGAPGLEILVRGQNAENSRLIYDIIYVTGGKIIDEEISEITGIPAGQVKKIRSQMALHSSHRRHLEDYLDD